MNKKPATVLAGLALAAIVSLSACGSTTETGTPGATSVAGSTPMTEKTPDKGMDKASETAKSEASKTADKGDGADAMTKGAYITYDQYQSSMAMYENSKVVLFFNAAWCPSCKAASSNFSKETIPDGLVIVSVDYDSSTELKQKYGITYQHTFVLIDKDGNQVKKWSGSGSAAEVEAQVA